VFFVISGYLITSLLIEDIDNKRFSILHFFKLPPRFIFPEDIKSASNKGVIISK